MEKTFDVEIITPDRVFYKGTADLLEFNTESGEIGVYRDHIPLTTVLEPGLVTIDHGTENQTCCIKSGSGFFQSRTVNWSPYALQFQNQTDLYQIEIPASVKTIGIDAFAGCNKARLTIVTPYGSAAETYAKANEIHYSSQTSLQIQAGYSKLYVGESRSIVKLKLRCHLSGNSIIRDN